MGVHLTDTFTEFVRRKAGDALRLVVKYTADSYTVEYARDDLRGQYAREDIGLIIDDMREISGLGRPGVLKNTVGNLQCQVLCYEDAVAIIFSTDDQSGILISMDASAASKLYQFATACRIYLDDPS